MKNILIISLGAFRQEYPYLYNFSYITSPGIQYVKRILDDSGYDTHIIDQPNSNLDIPEIITRIKEIDPEIVLFNQFYSTREQIRTIISHLPASCKVGIGGHDATFNAVYNDKNYTKEAYRHVNFIWQGEAENGLVDFLRTDLSDNTPIIYNNLNNRVRDLDSIPILEHDTYFGDLGFVVTSRGCYKNGCKFCSTSRFYPDGWRPRSFHNVERELLNLKNNGKKYIAIFDDNFFGFSRDHYERGINILLQCKELDLKVIFLMASVEQVIKLNDLYDLSVLEGTIANILLGVENVDEMSLKVLGKNCNIEKHKNRSFEAINCLYSHAISVYLGFINFNPYTTLDELKNNARFLYETCDSSSQFEYLSKRLQLFEGTSFFDEYIQMNGNSDLSISGQEYLYNFKDIRVGFISSILKLIKNETMVNDFIDYETSTLVYINKLQDSDLGNKYWDIKKRLSGINYEFFMYAVDICKNSNPSPAEIFNAVDNYKSNAKRITGELKELYLQIKNLSAYLISEPVPYIQGIKVE